MVEDEACLSTGGVYILSESKVAKDAKERRRVEWAAIPYVLMRPFFISPFMRRRRRYRALEGITYQAYGPIGLDLKQLKRALK